MLKKSESNIATSKSANDETRGEKKSERKYVRERKGLPINRRNGPGVTLQTEATIGMIASTAEFARR